MEDTTKIIGGLSEFKEDKLLGKGILQRIKEARTQEEVEYLLRVGKTYKNVTLSTMKKWVKAANNKGFNALVSNF